RGHVMNGPRLAGDSLGVKDPRSGVARDGGFTLLQEVACACSVAICGSTTCRAGCAPRIDHPISKTTGRRTRSGRMADEPTIWCSSICVGSMSALLSLTEDAPGSVCRVRAAD